MKNKYLKYDKKIKLASVRAVEKMRNILKQSSLSARTQSIYCMEVQLFFRFNNHLTPKEINENLVVDYICHLKDNYNYSISKYRSIYNSVRYFFNNVLKKPFDESFKLLPRNEHRLPNVMSVQEVKRLIYSCSGIKSRLALMLTYSAGLRFREVINLRISDIDTEHLKVFIREGKGTRERVSILSSKIIPELEKYLEKYKPEVYLFNGMIKGTKLSRDSMRRYMSKTCKKAGFTQKYNFYTLRHSFATHLMDMGVSIYTLKELLGHHCISSTILYLKLSSKQFDSLFSPLDMLIN